MPGAPAKTVALQAILFRIPSGGLHHRFIVKLVVLILNPAEWFGDIHDVTTLSCI